MSSGRITHLAGDGKTYGFIRPITAKGSDRSQNRFFCGAFLDPAVSWDALFVGQSVEFEEATDGARAIARMVRPI